MDEEGFTDLGTFSWNVGFNVLTKVSRVTTISQRSLEKATVYTEWSRNSWVALADCRGRNKWAQRSGLRQRILHTSQKNQQRSVLFGKAQRTCHSEHASVEKFSSGSPLQARGDCRRGSLSLGSLRVLGMMWSLLKITAARDFPGSPGVKNLLCSARDVSSICGWRTKIPHFVDQLLSLQLRPDVAKTKYKRIFFLNNRVQMAVFNHGKAVCVGDASTTKNGMVKGTAKGVDPQKHVEMEIVKEDMVSLGAK